jgi:hypothetical protein
MNEFYSQFLVSDSLYYPRDLAFYSDLSGHTGFASLYAVTLESAEAVRRAGTVAGFAGPVWAERLWLDVDGYDLAEEVELKLNKMELDYVAYDSGSKGAHFGILRDHPPSHLLPKKDRLWAREHFPQTDSSIYTPLHLFRLPGTVHEKTGRTKEIVRVQAGQKLRLPEIATNSPGLGKFQPNSMAESIFKDGRLLHNIKQARVGERHPTLVKIAYALKDKETDPSIAQWFLNEVNKLFPEAKDVEQVNKIVESIWRH